MAKTLNMITCPRCGHRFDVEEVLSHQLEEEMKAKLENERNKLEKAFKDREKDLADREQSLDRLRAEQNEIMQKRLQEERNALKQQLTEEIRGDFQKQLKTQEEEINERKKQFQELKDKEIELERLKRRFDERDKELQLEYEKMLNSKQREIEEAISKRERERIELTLGEKEKKLEDLRKQIKEMERKAEQGSMQLQGEVQERAIEEILRDLCMFDEIQEVPKGKRGADVIQTVRDDAYKTCGKIIYESKRTKTFNTGWIEKLRKDQLNERADIAVLVSQVLPHDSRASIAIQDGVWICNYQSFQGLVLALRDGLIKVHQASESQKYKGDKLNMLYNYLTSNEFRLQIETIIEGFLNLRESIQKERVAMEKLWAEREKQLEKVLLNTSNFFGAIKGIAGTEIPAVSLLELPGTEA